MLSSISALFKKNLLHWCFVGAVVLLVCLFAYGALRQAKTLERLKTIQTIEKSTAIKVAIDEKVIQEQFDAPNPAIQRNADRMLADYTSKRDQLPSAEPDTTNADRSSPRAYLGPQYQLRADEIEALEATGLLRCDERNCK